MLYFYTFDLLFVIDFVVCYGLFLLLKILKCEISYKPLYDISWEETYNWLSAVKSY